MPLSVSGKVEASDYRNFPKEKEESIFALFSVRLCGTSGIIEEVIAVVGGFLLVQGPSIPSLLFLIFSPCFRRSFRNSPATGDSGKETGDEPLYKQYIL